MCLSGNQPSRTLSYQQGRQANPTRANFRDQRRIESPILRPECSEPRAYIALGLYWEPTGSESQLEGIMTCPWPLTLLSLGPQRHRAQPRCSGLTKAWQS